MIRDLAVQRTRPSQGRQSPFETHDPGFRPYSLSSEHSCERFAEGTSDWTFHA